MRSGLSKKKRLSLARRKLQMLERSGPNRKKGGKLPKVESEHVVGSGKPDHRGCAILAQSLGSRRTSSESDATIDANQAAKADCVASPIAPCPGRAPTAQMW
jgi:hypothetical protein